LRPGRRLLAAVVWLIVFDQFVPGLLRRVEHRRYEETQAFRFESSDLFGLGPLISYFRDHPRGERPRAVFMGNSVMFGYELPATDAIPARFQALHPETQVFNAAVNGFDLGSNYLAAKAMIDDVDRFYIMRGTAAINPRLADLIAVDPDDARAFHLQAVDPIETGLRRIANRWQFYRESYRLQAGIFGTSSREYIHRWLSPMPSRVFAEPGQTIPEVTMTTWDGGRAPDEARRADLRSRDALLWRFAELLSAHKKRTDFLQIGTPTGAMGEPEIADFNAAFSPWVRIVGLTIPPELLYDGRHVTPEGARRVAAALLP
jgi:hypothetical protein